MWRVSFKPLLFPSAFATMTRTKLSDLRSQSSYLSSAGVLQPTGIQPNLHQNSNDTQPASRTWFAANFGQLNNKDMSGFGNVANACNLSVRPLLCVLSLVNFWDALHRISLSWKRTTRCWRKARLTEANHRSHAGCQFPNSALKKMPASNPFGQHHFLSLANIKGHWGRYQNYTAEETTHFVRFGPIWESESHSKRYSINEPQLCPLSNFRARSWHHHLSQNERYHQLQIKCLRRTCNLVLKGIGHVREQNDMVQHLLVLSYVCRKIDAAFQ